MFIQIDVWGSKELATWIMRNYTQNLWIENANEKDASIARVIQPSYRSNNTAIGQFGSLFPKLLYLYDVPEHFLVKQPARLTACRASVSDTLDTYYDFEIGYRSRATDKDAISVYPYLDIESKDYFTSHNIESHSGGEQLLQLIYQQLQNIDPAHCYMTQIRAYDRSFDVCYQSISVRNPLELKDPPCDTAIDINDCWVGEKTIGYPTHQIKNENLIEFETESDFLSLATLKDLTATKNLDWDALSKIELHQRIKWSESFQGEYQYMTHSLFGDFKGWTIDLDIEGSVNKIPFDWDIKIIKEGM